MGGAGGRVAEGRQSSCAPWKTPESPAAKEGALQRTESPWLSETRRACWSAGYTAVHSRRHGAALEHREHCRALSETPRETGRPDEA